MANMTLIEAKTSTSSSVTFSSIPQTYTDLRIVISSRDNDNGNPWTRFDIELNSDTTSGNYRTKYGYSTGSGTGSSSGNEVAGYSNSSGNTAATFSNCEIYIPSYSATIAKSWTWNAVTSQMATAQLDVYGLGDWSSTAPITQVTIKTPGTFLAGSTFYLYGIPNTTVAAKATGGTVYSDGVYNYHTFLETGTFTPTTSLTADILVIAGGGGSTDFYGGGGGGGGIAYLAGGSLTATAYTCTVGAGGAGVSSTIANSGTNSSIAGSGFSTITANGGGGGGGNSANPPVAGGSGGGGGGYWSYNITGAASNQGSSGGSTGYGNSGGNGVLNEAISGGGGGAGTAGANGTGTNASNSAISGNGGFGLSNWSSWAVATRTGDRGYYAGGGGGGGRSDANFTMYGLGGIGGGGNGRFGSTYPIGNGMANTGGGGGGTWNGSSGSGGSGLVIIRYAK